MFLYITLPRYNQIYFIEYPSFYLVYFFVRNSCINPDLNYSAFILVFLYIISLTLCFDLNYLVQQLFFSFRSIPSRLQLQFLQIIPLIPVDHWLIIRTRSNKGQTLELLLYLISFLYFYNFFWCLWVDPLLHLLFKDLFVCLSVFIIA